MKIDVELEVYDQPAGEGRKTITLKRHWNQSHDLVVLTVEGKSVAVRVDQLNAAISACTAGGLLT
jgi:hypothetical protein